MHVTQPGACNPIFFREIIIDSWSSGLLHDQIVESGVLEQDNVQYKTSWIGAHIPQRILMFWFQSCSAVYFAAFAGKNKLTKLFFF